MAKHKKKIVERRPWFDEHVFINWDFAKEIAEFETISKLSAAETGLAKNTLGALKNEQKRAVELLAHIDDKDLRDELSICFDNVFLDSRLVGKFTEPLPFIKKQIDDERAERARKKTEELAKIRQDIISEKYKRKPSISNACAKLIIGQLKKDFEAAGVPHSESVIKRDIKKILSEKGHTTK